MNEERAAVLLRPAEATLPALKEKGAPRVVLSTAEKNGAAQRLFARAGFRRTMIEMTRETQTPADRDQTPPPG